MKKAQELTEIFSICKGILGEEKWDILKEDFSEPGDIPDRIISLKDEMALPDFLPELAKLEFIYYKVSNKRIDHVFPEGTFEINPTLEILKAPWRFSSFMRTPGWDMGSSPEKGEEWVMIWKDAGSGEMKIGEAGEEELMSLKILSDGISITDAAKIGGLSEKNIEEALYRSAGKGIILSPRSKLKRDISIFSDSEDIPGKYIYADIFTLQWHITHACDLRCKHCYDRSDRSPLTLEQGNRVLNDMAVFCRENLVKGHICFTGGNPLMHPDFFKLYKAAADKGFSTSILGNPTTHENIKKIVDVQKPGYFQVSLEGVEDHNDFIRGKGYFKRVMGFFDILRDHNISSAVMLTLTDANIDQILPLVDIIREHTDYFTFNRLSQVGEGASLGLPSKEEYVSFLKEYVKVSENSRIMGFKDNLINIILEDEGSKLFDGCTGYGCGAAFNFLTALPDGETHACRKFPSPVGNILEDGISGVYNSDLAAKYRRGCAECDGCSIRHVCGGCLAISSGNKQDVFLEKDPYCFK